MPAFDWPIADFPRYKYPLEQNADFNLSEDKRCLSMVEQLIEKHANTSPVAGMILEPIQGEGGDNHGSTYFFQQLRRICTERKVAFIIDEVG